nr:MAG TPA: hypothetical protein [Caudoviricetes sp.]
MANGLKVVASSSATMGNSLEETIGLTIRSRKKPLIDGESLRALSTKIYK